MDPPLWKRGVREDFGRFLGSVKVEVTRGVFLEKRFLS